MILETTEIASDAFVLSALKSQHSESMILTINLVWTFIEVFLTDITTEITHDARTPFYLKP
jgi:hypothetical protein